MLTVGLTGGIGTGKTTVTDLFRELGAYIVDADIEARNVVMPGEPALVEISKYFGNSILTLDGHLNRPELRKRIFQSPDDRLWLESVLHPLIHKRVQRQLKQDKPSPYQIYCAPLLLENGLETIVDCVVVVDCPEQIQIERAAQRDASRREEIKRIIHSQIPRSERLSRADYVIDNSGSKAQTAEQVQYLNNLFDKKAQELLKPHE